MSLEVSTVESARDMRAFIDVAWKVQGGRDTPWVPPLRSMIREALDPDKDPFWKEADRALFVARRDGRLVGRIAAIENRRHNQVHQDRVGFFGFFECMDDRDAAQALFARAEAWLSERGLTSVRGPMNPSMNHECGVLIDGFDQHPTLMTPWNPPWYDPLVQAAGYESARTTVAYHFPISDGFRAPERITRIVDQRVRREGIKVRRIDLSKIDDEAELLRPLYNQIWEDNWGFVPVGTDEFRYIARSLKPLVRPETTLVAEIEGRPVAFFIAAMDLNRILKRFPNGRLGPLRLLRLLFGLRRLRSTRIILLGVENSRRNGVLLPLLILELQKSTIAMEGFADASWILEDNMALRGPLESMGVTPSRRWRIYQKPLPDAAPVPTRS